MLLAFDTSTSVASVALVADSADTADGARLVAELTWRVGQRHSTELLERLEWLLAASRLSMSDLTGVAVALGPGSFNGVRVALATAKSLAFARGVPLYGVPTLDIIAWGHCLIGGTICAILEAGRGQVYVAIYDAAQPDAARWEPAAGYQVLTAAELAAQIHSEALFCGEMSPETRATLAEALGSRFRATSALDERRAGWLAELALARSAAQRYDDPVALEPLYLRRPAITTSARRRLPTSAEDADEAAGMASNAIIATQQGSATMRREERE
jgi:tRNA threonylcarbamoyladenosine biosynthesis protein TsaB